MNDKMKAGDKVQFLDNVTKRVCSGTLEHDDARGWFIRGKKRWQIWKMESVTIMSSVSPTVETTRTESVVRPLQRLVDDAFSAKPVQTVQASVAKPVEKPMTQAEAMKFVEVLVELANAGLIPDTRPAKRKIGLV